MLFFLESRRQRLRLTNRCWVALSIAICAFGEAESHLWLSTHYHDNLATYHVEEDATTEKILLLSVYKPFSAMLFLLLIFEGFSNGVLVYPDRGVSK